METKSKKEVILGAIRPILTAVLAMVAAKYFQDQSVLEGAVASIFMAASIIWSLIDKSEKGISIWLSAARHILGAASGILVALYPDSKITEIVAILVTALTAISGGISNKGTVAVPK